MPLLVVCQQSFGEAFQGGRSVASVGSQMSVMIPETASNLVLV
jgi:hypothetical protein